MNQKITNMDISIIKKIVEAFFELEPGSSDLNTRKREIVLARQTTMYFALIFTKMSSGQIGFLCGKKDHATVLYAKKTVINLIQTNKRFKADINILYNKIDSIIKTPHERILNALEIILKELSYVDEILKTETDNDESIIDLYNDANYSLNSLKNKIKNIKNVHTEKSIYSGEEHQQ